MMTHATNSRTAIILAGQRPGPDALAVAFGGTVKALVPICGEPMITRVVRTLSDTPELTRIIVMAQDTHTLQAAIRSGCARAEAMPSGAGIATSLLALADEFARDGRSLWPALVTTADHPLLTTEMVQAFLAKAQGADLAIGMVERQTMLRAYPNNQRTWLKFRDGFWSGANLFALNSAACEPVLRVWAEAEQDRKKPWKLFLHFGPWLALRAITRTIGLHEALAAIGNRFGLTIRLVPLDQAEAAIDVDKPSDHVEATAILERRGIGA